MAKRALRTISTNWIHLVGFYVTTYLTLILFKVTGLDTSDGWEPIVLTGFVSTFLLFMIYGLMIIGWFYFAIIVLDIISFSWLTRWTRQILLFEWLIISIPFIYWAFKYDYWLWLTLSASFLLTQMLRRKRIDRILSFN